MSGTVTNPRAFTVLELLIVIVCLAIVAAIILTVFSRAKQRAGRISCTCNLKQIGLSFRTWALDNRDKYPMQILVTNGGAMEWAERGIASVCFEVMSNELSMPMVLFCPNDKTRTNAHSFSQGFNNTCISYFIGADALDIYPQMFLCGDDNLLVNGAPIKRGLVTLSTNQSLSWSATRHVYQGNIALADGSVQQFNNSRLWQAFTNTGVTTNRLILP
jgi:competence protein ComGC